MQGARRGGHSGKGAAEDEVEFAPAGFQGGMILGPHLCSQEHCGRAGMGRHACSTTEGVFGEVTQRYRMFQVVHCVGQCGTNVWALYSAFKVCFRVYRVEDMWKIQAVCSVDGLMVTEKSLSAAAGAPL